MTRRPVKGLAPRLAVEPAPRPPGPTEILGPDGRVWLRHADGLYYDEEQTEVFSQGALRDLIARAAERLAIANARTPDPVLNAIVTARTVDELRDIWPRTTTREQRAAILGRRAALELPPKGDR
ncbi:MAG TPA: hypothetical protein VK611_08270 [Acidimicrobiales bacterium]|uniref:hypothetical protein n=1 Tax=Pseudonocardia sp. TaxID=60912 RepID=UPI002B6F729C|nr:hypothetical protein [Pseudonocardia sp.]HMG41310.1 hypothetical protein [Acidimicrobiales bacterium]HTF49367.1 hypothetical protein [Pseudonocardia sp.]